VGYRLVPGENCLPYMQEDAIFRKRAGFAYKHVWVTRFHPEERYAAGEYPNLHPGGAGLPAFVSDDEPIVDEDIVLWYSLGHNHLPRTEDWPIMPIWKMGFMLKPNGFFDRNPTLDIPPARSSHSCHHGGS
jgi:primary-amine oxidase